MHHLIHRAMSHLMPHPARHLMHLQMRRQLRHLLHHLMHQALSQAVHQHFIHAVTAHMGAIRVMGESATRQQAPLTGRVVVLRGMSAWLDVNLHIKHMNAR